MSNAKTIILISSHPYSPNGQRALTFLQNKLDNHTLDKHTHVFLYGDGTMFANALTWGQDNPVMHMQALACQLAPIIGDIKVCVASALARGVCDASNAKRHHICVNGGDDSDNTTPHIGNVAKHFSLTGLGNLALLLDANAINFHQF